MLKFRSNQIAVAIAVSSVFVLTNCSGPNSPSTDIITSTATPATRKITSPGVVKAQPQLTEITAGETSQAVVKLAIEHGFHLNANPPTFPYLIATELQIKPSAGFKLGKVIYPAAKTAKFAFADQPLAVYEGDQEIKAEILTDKSTAKGSQTLAATLRVQACDEQVCYPPGTIDLQIPVTVK